MPATARLRRLSAGLEYAHRPEPAVNPRRLHRRIVARAATSWVPKRDGRCPAFDRVLPSRPGQRTISRGLGRPSAWDTVRRAQHDGNQRARCG
jgi:hypothetical protein